MLLHRYVDKRCFLMLSIYLACLLMYLALLLLYIIF